MRIVFLPPARFDLRWMRNYYTTIFPDGKERTERQFDALLTALRAHPYLGRESDTVPTARQLAIPRTPFVLIYRVREDRIEILRVADSRSRWSM